MMKKILVSIAVVIVAGLLIYQGLKPSPKVVSIEENGAPVALDSTPKEEGSGLSPNENIPELEIPPSDSSPIKESAEAEMDSGPIERPSPVPPDSEILRADNAQSEALTTRLASDSRIQGAAIIQSVQCDSGTCLVSAQAKATMEQEIQTAFTLFQRDYPEFGSKFKMEISPDAQGVSTFMFAP
jgi:hypothetical protein